MFFLQNCIDSLEEAFIHPQIHLWHFLLWMDALYWTSFLLLKNNTQHPLPL